MFINKTKLLVGEPPPPTRPLRALVYPGYCSQIIIFRALYSMQNPLLRQVPPAPPHRQGYLGSLHGSLFSGQGILFPA